MMLPKPAAPYTYNTLHRQVFDLSHSVPADPPMIHPPARGLGLRFLALLDLPSKSGICTFVFETTFLTALATRPLYHPTT